MMTQQERASEIAFDYVIDLAKKLIDDPKVIKARLERMTQSPYAFYSCNPQLFLHDISQTFKDRSMIIPGAPQHHVINVDCHIGNQGVMGQYDAPDDKLIWGLNDFDCAERERADIDLCRAAGSIAMVTYINDEISRKKDLRNAISALYDGYEKAIRRADPKKGPYIYNLDKLDKEKPYKAILHKARESSQRKLVNKFCVSPNFDEFVHKPNYLERISKGLELYNQLEKIMQTHLKNNATLKDIVDIDIEAKPLDIARRIGSGGSSYGLHKYWFLIPTSHSLPRIFEVKELVYLPDTSHVLLSRASEAAKHNAEHTRSLGGYAFNPFYDGINLFDRPYIVREREAISDGFEEDDMKKWSDKDLELVAYNFGKLLGRSFVKSCNSEITDYIKLLDSLNRDDVKNRLYDFALAYGERCYNDWTYVLYTI